MTFSDRLARLRQDAGVGAEETVSLASRVARLRPLSRQTEIAAVADVDLAGHLNGRLLCEGLILLEERFPLAARHGVWPLRMVEQQTAGLAELEGVDPHRLVFLDTETTGLSGGCGTQVFLLGMARIVDGQLLMRQYLLSRLCGEAAMLDAARTWMSESDILVSYNGKTFDIPLLSSRCRLARLPNPFSDRRHIDLLYPLRRAFSRCWPDCRLATVESRLLGFQRRDDLPGSEAPAAWFDWLRHGEPARLPGVCRHNRWDLVSLVVLLPVLSRVYNNPVHHAADLPSVARAQIACGRVDLAIDMLRDGRRNLDEKSLLELARLYRRKGHWRQSLVIWKSLAATGSGKATEHLAKYFEHVAGDYVKALTHANRLPQQTAYRRRCRLQRKITAALRRQP